MTQEKKNPSTAGAAKKTKRRYTVEQRIALLDEADEHRVYPMREQHVALPARALHPARRGK